MRQFLRYTSILLASQAICMIATAQIAFAANPSASFTTGSPLTVSEGLNPVGVFRLQLAVRDSVPIMEGTVSATVSDGNCTVSGDGSGYSTSATATLSYAYQGQYHVMINVRAVNNEVVDGTHTCTIRYTAHTDDPYYDGLSQTFPVTITDDDTEPFFRANKWAGSLIAEGEAIDLNNLFRQFMVACIYPSNR